LLQRQNRVERAAWTYSMARAHRFDPDRALAQAEVVFHPTEEIQIGDAPPEPFLAGWLGESIDTDHLYRILPLTYDLPRVFQAFLAMTPPERQELRVREGLRTGIHVPGDPFRHRSWLWKRALGAEAMQEAGFSYWYLGPDALGIPEIRQSLGGGAGGDLALLGSDWSHLALEAAQQVGDDLGLNGSFTPEALAEDFLEELADEVLEIDLREIVLNRISSAAAQRIREEIDRWAQDSQDQLFSILEKTTQKGRGHASKIDIGTD
jgi:hypothetical protein